MGEKKMPKLELENIRRESKGTKRKKVAIKERILIVRS